MVPKWPSVAVSFYGQTWPMYSCPNNFLSSHCQLFPQSFNGIWGLWCLQGCVICGGPDELSPEPQEWSGGQKQERPTVYRDGQDFTGRPQSCIRRGDAKQQAQLVQKLLDILNHCKAQNILYACLISCIVAVQNVSDCNSQHCQKGYYSVYYHKHFFYNQYYLSKSCLNLACL